jgi:pimeloyl-ACP methyl ester carboxylesterase
MSAITTKDGVQLHYKDWGMGQPIVFSQGWPLSSDDWDAQMLFFGQHGYRVIAHDRRGHGRSTQTWAPKLLKRATLRVYKGLPRGMCATNPELINNDLLAFFEGAAATAAAMV